MNAIEKKHYNVVGDSLEQSASINATITKQTTLGFIDWIKSECDTVSDGHGVYVEHKGNTLSFEELYDLYVQSLEA